MDHFSPINENYYHASNIIDVFLYCWYYTSLQYWSGDVGRVIQRGRRLMTPTTKWCKDHAKRSSWRITLNGVRCGSW